MTLHNDPKYQTPELISSLIEHGLPTDSPSQNADAFRCGWVARECGSNYKDVTYHLRQHGDVTKEQLDHYINTDGIKVVSTGLNDSKDLMPGYSHWEERIKDLMKQTAHPDSHSVARAMKQLCNEMMQATKQEMLASSPDGRKASAFEQGKLIYQNRNECLYYKYPCVVGIDSPPGTTVIFDAEGGYEPEKKDALNILEIGKQYVIEYTKVNISTFYIKLVGYAGLFNSAMFTNIKGKYDK